MSEFLKVPIHFCADRSVGLYLLLSTFLLYVVSGVLAQDDVAVSKGTAHYIIVIRDSSLPRYPRHRPQYNNLLNSLPSMLGELLVKQRDTNSAFRAIQSGDRLPIVLAAAYLDGEFRDEYFQSNRKCPTHGTWRELGAGTAPIVEPDQYFKFVPDKELVIWQDSVKLEEAKNILSFDPCFFGDGFSGEYAYRAVLDWMKSTDVKGQAIPEFFIIVVDFVRPYDSFKTLDKYNMGKLHEAANRASLAYRPYYIGTL